LSLATRRSTWRRRHPIGVVPAPRRSSSANQLLPYKGGQSTTTSLAYQLCLYRAASSPPEARSSPAIFHGVGIPICDIPGTAACLSRRIWTTCMRARDVPGGYAGTLKARLVPFLASSLPSPSPFHLALHPSCPDGRPARKPFHSSCSHSLVLGGREHFRAPVGMHAAPPGPLDSASPTALREGRSFPAIYHGVVIPTSNTPTRWDGRGSICAAPSFLPCQTVPLANQLCPCQMMPLADQLCPCQKRGHSLRSSMAWRSRSAASLTTARDSANAFGGPVRVARDLPLEASSHPSLFPPRSSIASRYPDPRTLPAGPFAFPVAVFV
jgi:hypothetical protein